MPDSRSFHVTLPSDLAKLLKEKVASGAYGSESEVVLDGLRELMGRDVALPTDEVLESWLKTDVVAAYDAYHADPSIGIPGDQILERVQSRYRRLVEGRITAGT